MKYLSTRESTPSPEDYKPSARVIIEGLAPDGGLYIPEQIPRIGENFITSLLPKSYHERAAAVLELFLTDFTEDELLSACRAAYAPESSGRRPRL